jgi:hypothetical protein
MTVAGSYQRTSAPALPPGRRLHRLVLAASFLGCALPAAAAAGDGKYDRARSQHPDLFRVYYEEMVLDYCGLRTPESEAGFRLVRDALLAADPLSEEAHREVRVASSIAADYTYQDYGLSGQRRWCGTEGLGAYNRFVSRYRAQGGDSNDPMQ